MGLQGVDKIARVRRAYLAAKDSGEWAMVCTAHNLLKLAAAQAA